MCLYTLSSQFSISGKRSNEDGSSKSTENQLDTDRSCMPSHPKKPRKAKKHKKSVSSRARKLNVII